MTATLENEIELEFQPHQFDAMWADAPYVCLATGLGGGKTWAGARWILTRAIEFPDSLHLVTINSLPQAQDVVVPELDRAVEDLGLEFRWESKRQRPNLYVYTGDRWAEVRVRSTWHPDSIRGPEYGSWWGDEVRDAGREGLLVAMGRLRCKKVDVPRYRWSTTTNGHDLIWERHKKEATLERTYTDERSGKDVRIWRGKNQKRLLVQAATDVNRFVHEDYTTLLEENYDPELARQERDAEFITLGNLVYYAFNFARNVSDSVRYDPAGGLIVALDFNVEPCVATIIQEVAGETWVVGEISMEGGGTSAVIAEFQRRFPGRIGNMAPVIYGDPSGTRRDTRSNTSDYAMWQQAIPGSVVRVARSDPGFPARVNAVNARLLNALGEVHLRIHPSCTGLIADLEQVIWQSGARKIEKKNINLTHLSDSLAYYLAYVYPVRRNLDRARLASSDQRISL